MAKAFEGMEAVLSCLGVTGIKLPGTTVDLYSRSCMAIVGAMKKANIRRLIVMTSWCTVYDASHPKFIEWVFKVGSV